MLIVIKMVIIIINKIYANKCSNILIKFMLLMLIIIKIITCYNYISYNLC